MVRDWVTTEQARHLRRNAPLVERMLRDRLKERQLGVKFRRQHPMNPYIVDFCSVAAKLVVEIDGPFHDPTKDQLRDRELSDRGYRTIRLSSIAAVSYTHLRAHETVLDLVCRLLLEKKKKK